MDDQTLMLRVSKLQCEAALNELYRRHRPVLRSVIMRVLDVESEADDVLQDAFIQLWKQADSFSPAKGQLLGWLITVARRRALDRLRQRSAYQKATTRYEAQAKIPQEQFRETSTVEDEVGNNELRAMLDRLISELPKEQGDVVNLTFFKGLSQREIAAKLQLPLGTVKTRIELGVRKLSRCPIFQEAA